MNKFIIDFELLEEFNISIEYLIKLIKILKNWITYDNINYEHDCDWLLKLEEDGCIKINHKDEIIILRQKGIDILEAFKIDNNELIFEKPIDKFDEFIEEYRCLFKGLKPGSMGSPEGCKTKMIKWMKDNPSYNQEDILKATKMYIRQVDNLKYLQKAHYFIYKDGTSNLSSFIDEQENPTDGWSSQLK